MTISEPMKNRLPEREMLKDWRGIRRSIGMGSRENLLTAERMRRVIHELSALPGRKTSYSPYDLAHLFILKHMSEALGKRIPSLERNEKKLGIAILGQVHNEPPASQYSERKEAAEKLAKMGKKGNLIFSVIRHEYNKLNKKRANIGEVPHEFSDNPILGKCMELRQGYSVENGPIEINNVSDFAKLLSEREEREKERKNEA